jgi:hypothetical protein
MFAEVLLTNLLVVRDQGGGHREAYPAHHIAGHGKQRSAVSVLSFR